MTSANMKLVILRVPVDNADAFENLPEQLLERDEFIIRRVILLDKLRQELQGAYFFLCAHLYHLSDVIHPAYTEKVGGSLAVPIRDPNTALPLGICGRCEAFTFREWL